MNDILKKLSPHQLGNFQTLKIGELSSVGEDGVYDWSCLRNCTALQKLALPNPEYSAEQEEESLQLMNNLPASSRISRLMIGVTVLGGMLVKG